MSKSLIGRYFFKYSLGSYYFGIEVITSCFWEIYNPFYVAMIKGPQYKRAYVFPESFEKICQKTTYASK